jgi:hypothetical protein
MSVKMRFAVVCSSNMNRSMEAHAFLQKKGYDIHSYGTGDKIKIPGMNLELLEQVLWIRDISVRI